MTSMSQVACRRPDCFPNDTGCAAGNISLSDCSDFNQEQDASGVSDREVHDESFPWSGRQLGTTDIRFITAAQRHHVVGIAGPAGSGKTTLLSLLFLAIYRGHSVGKFRFAGSYSLLGWENIAHHLQLTPGQGINFPPHTTRSGRSPGLLHLAVSENNSKIARDVVLADSSGEWFSAWTDNPSDSAASGAAWVVENSDRMLVIADTEALIGENRGAVRRELDFLIRRLQDVCGKDGIAMVWTKNDVERPEAVTSAVEGMFRQCFGEAPIFEVGFPKSETASGENTVDQLKSIFSWAFELRTRVIVDTDPSTDNPDSFLSFRGKGK